MPYEKDKSVNFSCPVYWGVADHEKFEYHISELSKMVDGFHFADNMFLWQRSNSMIRDSKFLEAWQSNIVSESDKGIIWRRYILCTLAFHASKLSGDFVECGAYEGVGAKIVRDYLGQEFGQRTFWLYDLFEHDDNSINHAMPSHSKELYTQVRERFIDYTDIMILKGSIPDVFANGVPDKIAYLHIDLNQAPAEIATLDFLFEKVVPGGVIIFDDYEYFYYRAQKYAEDDWLSSRGYKITPLPTSQGFLIKR